MKFDPNASAQLDSGIFGLPYSAEDSNIVIIPVPWEATVSYGSGASDGPKLVLEASHQVDLFDLEIRKSYETGYFLDKFPDDIYNLSVQAKRVAQRVIQKDHSEEELDECLGAVNQYSEELNSWLFYKAQNWTKKSKVLGVLGGDHSSPLGLLRHMGDLYGSEWGVLHIDAHADLRKAYGGFTYSHASIMYNLMTGRNPPKKLVQVGVRDICEEEYEFIQSNANVETHFDLNIQRALCEGRIWNNLCEEIIEELPEKVYISFDIDGLEPSLCPNTGTPVPGGLSFFQATTLLKSLYEKNKKIIGFDLNEVSGGEHRNPWNGVIGARMLYKLCGWTAITNGFYRISQ